MTIHLGLRGPGHISPTWLTKSMVAADPTFKQVVEIMPGLVAFWPLTDAAASGTAADAGPNGLDMTANSVTFGTTAKFDASETATSAGLNGSSSYLSHAANAALDFDTADPFTVVVVEWNNAALSGVAGTYYWLVSNAEDGNGPGFSLGVKDNTGSVASLVVWLESNGGTSQRICLETAGRYTDVGGIADGTPSGPTMLAAVYDGSGTWSQGDGDAGLKLYRNGGGQLQMEADAHQTASGSIAAGNSTLSTGDWNIGRKNVTGEYFNGDVQYVAVFNRALTAAELETLYAAARPGAADLLTPLNRPAVPKVFIVADRDSDSDDVTDEQMWLRAWRDGLIDVVGYGIETNYYDTAAAGGNWSAGGAAYATLLYQYGINPDTDIQFGCDINSRGQNTTVDSANFAAWTCQTYPIAGKLVPGDFQSCTSAMRKALNAAGANEVEIWTTGGLQPVQDLLDSAAGADGIASTGAELVAAKCSCLVIVAGWPLTGGGVSDMQASGSVAQTILDGFTTAGVPVVIAGIPDGRSLQVGGSDSTMTGYNRATMLLSGIPYGSVVDYGVDPNTAASQVPMMGFFFDPTYIGAQLAGGTITVSTQGDVDFTNTPDSGHYVARKKKSDYAFVSAINGKIFEGRDAGSGMFSAEITAAQHVRWLETVNGLSVANSTERDALIAMFATLIYEGWLYQQDVFQAFFIGDGMNLRDPSRFAHVNNGLTLTKGVGLVGGATGSGLNSYTPWYPGASGAFGSTTDHSVTVYPFVDAVGAGKMIMGTNQLYHNGRTTGTTYEARDSTNTTDDQFTLPGSSCVGMFVIDRNRDAGNYKLFREGVQLGATVAKANPTGFGAKAGLCCRYSSSNFSANSEWDGTLGVFAAGRSSEAMTRFDGTAGSLANVRDAIRTCALAYGVGGI